MIVWVPVCSTLRSFVLSPIVLSPTGFYTFDLNDSKLHKLGPGHAEGRRSCVKTKLALSIPTQATDAHATVQDTMPGPRRQGGGAHQIGNAARLAEGRGRSPG